MEETRTSRPLKGRVRRNGTVIIDGFGFWSTGPRMCNWGHGAGLRSATEPDKSLVSQQVVSLHWEKCRVWHSTRLLPIDEKVENNEYFT